ncbi:MAG: hypothetical protein M1338_05220 [Patescibacteria group bacterium]|nr:hypothetical protein [Patescibacteria group bacterium]
MSLIDDLIIALEENSKMNLDEACDLLKDKSRQIISSGLGRLSAKGLVDKIKNGKSYYFKLTKLGQETIDNQLSALANIKINESDRSWQILVFDIPEKKRKLRDDLRRFLEDNGFGRLHSSIWLSSHDNNKNLEKYILTNDLGDFITMLNTKKLNDSEEKDLASKLHWDWLRLNNEYKKFIANAQKYLKLKNKNSYTAKKLVLEFAKVYRQDPKLPKRLQPSNHLLDKAHKFYQECRK